jgi:hypothetical protein
MSRRYSVQCNGTEVASFDDPDAAKIWEAGVAKVRLSPLPMRSPVKWTVIDTQTNQPVP